MSRTTGEVKLNVDLMIFLSFYCRQENEMTFSARSDPNRLVEIEATIPHMIPLIINNITPVFLTEGQFQFWPIDYVEDFAKIDLVSQ